MKVRIKTGDLARTEELYGIYPHMRGMQNKIHSAKVSDSGAIRVYTRAGLAYIFAAEDVEEIKSQDFELILDIMAFNAIAKARDIEPDYKTRLEKVSAILSNRVSEKDTYTLADLSDYLIAKYL